MRSLGAKALTPLPRRLTVAFGVLVLAGMLVADRQAALLGAASGHASVVDAAAAFDLTVGLTVATWWLLGRELGWGPGTLIPLYFAALAVAGLVLPEGHREGLKLAHLAAAPLELFALGFLAGKVRAGRRAFRKDTAGGDGTAAPQDIQEALGHAAAAALGPGRMAHAIAYEMSVLYYGLLARGGDADAGDALSYHRKSAWGAVVFALLMATTVEVLAVHFLVSLWSHRLAWILTGLGLYGALWMYGDWRACRLRPVRVDDGVLRIRFGLRWRVDVPLDAVTELRAPTPEERATKGSVDLRLALPGSPWQLLTLDRPVQAEGIYGLRRSVRTLGLGLDEPRRLDALLAPAPTSNEERT